MIAPRHAGHDMAGMDMPGMDSGATSFGGEHAMTMKMYVHGTIGGDVLWFRSWQPQSAGATVGVCIGLFLLAILDRYLHALWRACTAAWARGRVGFTLPVANGAEPYTTSNGGTKLYSRAEDEDDAGSTRALPPIAATNEKDEKLSLRRSRDSFAPAPCQCGCGGECGASSAPVYRAEAEPAEQAVAAQVTQAAATGQNKTLELEQLAQLEKIAPAPAPGPPHLPAAARRTLDPARQGRWSRPFRWNADVPRGLLWGVQTSVHYLLMLVVMTFQIYWIISVVVGAAVGEALFGRFGAR